MSDVNVMIIAVDKAIDILNKYYDELSDIHARGKFDIESIIALVNKERYENQEKLNELIYLYGNSSIPYSEELINEQNDYERISLLQKKQEAYDVLYDKVAVRCEDKINVWDFSYKKYVEIIDYGKRIMGEYIHKLNQIGVLSEGFHSRSVGKVDYYVVVIDSRKYPQTAEHIKWAFTRGLPEFVTLGREEATNRRKESLREIKTRPEYDRDEWPMACFEEGGYGADVAYVERSDNRGAGSCIGRQMRCIPDGSRIRLRII